MKSAPVKSVLRARYTPRLAVAAASDQVRPGMSCSLLGERLRVKPAHIPQVNVAKDVTSGQASAVRTERDGQDARNHTAAA
jgi:hypothetical protein